LIQLAIKEADNGIKLVVLMKLRDSILARHPAIIQACVLDLLRILAAPDATIRSVCLELIAAGTSSRVASEIVQFLKKELVKSEGDSSYRRELLDALHICSIKFSEVATEVMTCYLDLLKSGYASETLISFIK
jgi:coatomer subunit beta